MDKQRWMVVGLGNPGPRYEENRHSIGFMVVDALSVEEADLSWQRSSRFQSFLAKGRLAGREAILVKPQTFMNLSGRAVASLAHFYGVEPARIIAAHDDVDLPLGRLKIKSGGGDGGHKGVRSLAAELGSADFVRVRVGIGRPERGEVADFVLRDFDATEAEQVREAVRAAGEAVRIVISEGLQRAMNRFHGQPAAEPAGRGTGKRGPDKSGPGRDGPGPGEGAAP